ncbi:MAG: sigma-70 family RNA polymerase sigma factor [bacterium]|nr:sigma-70 family RNA polymerase sigma factor [bacterium]
MQHALETGKPASASEELARIYRDHHRLVLSAAYRVTGSPEDAEDVLQTVFMRLARREGGSPLSDSPAGYLHRAAVNAALDLMRSRHVSRTSSIGELEPLLADSETNSPDRAQGSVEIRDQIRTALAKMSPMSAEIFILRYFEGYGNNEIAGMLGKTRSTVNVILHRTRQKLREEIGPYVGEAQ